MHLVVRDATRRDGTDGTESTRQRRPREVRFGRVRVSDQGRRRAAPRWNARGSNLARRRRRREKNRPAGHRGDGGGGRGEVGIARGEVGIARGEVGKVRRDDVSGASVGGFRGENAARDANRRRDDSSARVSRRRRRVATREESRRDGDDVRRGLVRVVAEDAATSLRDGPRGETVSDDENRRTAPRDARVHARDARRRGNPSNRPIFVVAMFFKFAASSSAWRPSRIETCRVDVESNRRRRIREHVRDGRRHGDARAAFERASRVRRRDAPNLRGRDPRRREGSDGSHATRERDGLGCEPATDDRQRRRRGPIRDGGRRAERDDVRDAREDGDVRTARESRLAEGTRRRPRASRRARERRAWTAVLRTAPSPTTTPPRASPSIRTRTSPLATRRPRPS